MYGMKHQCGMRGRHWLWIRFWVVFAGISVVVWAGDDSGIEFNRDIRPILSEHCFTCHGPDARKREAGLRLDDEQNAKSVQRSGSRAIVPGDLEESELVARIDAEEKDVVMPPPQSGKPLTFEQKERLKKWISTGAPWEAHWSLAPLKRPLVPADQDQGFVRNPIDRFILARLRQQGLDHAPEADRVTLIRRLSFDLRGLPPTPEEVEQFGSDRDERAYERLVDKMLASPQFGERMAIFWLDLVRYADSVGYHGDQPVSVSPFRDYVIQAFNNNKRFDQFTIEQLAGDLLPGATREQRVAAGYNRLGMMSAEGGVQPKEYLAKYAAERVRNLGGAWLGVTLGCCECHDHKYDPFTSRDFYRLEAFFADIQERGLYDLGNFGPTLQVPTPEQSQALMELDREILALEQWIDRDDAVLDLEQQVWERISRPETEWTILKPLSVKSSGGATLAVLDDGSVLASGISPATDTYTFTTRLPIQGVTAIRVEALPHESLPNKGPGRAGNGNFVLTELQASLSRSSESTPQPLVLENASASFEQTEFVGDNPYKAFTAVAAIDGDKKGAKWGWAVLPETGRTNEAVFETAIDIMAGHESILSITLAQNLDNPQHTLGRFRLSVTSEPRPRKAFGQGLPRGVRDALAIAPLARNGSDRSVLRSYYRSIAPQLLGEHARLSALQQNRRELNAQITTMLATETVPPRTIRVLPRGNWMNETGEVVDPGVPSALPQPSTPREGSRLNRLDLARWLVDSSNPLTSRSLVNRLWKLFFGAGLSRKLDDLGSQGEWPSHPELLDWLAVGLIDSGWDIKELVKQIVTSGTYRQSSIATSDQRERDPYNRWLGRQAGFRLDAELVRDTALEVSGLLVPEIGGRSVKPYQPPGYWSFLNFPVREWEKDQGREAYRRGLYTHWQRQYLYPSLLAFDAPSREECTAERVRSNTPLQALVLLNDPVYVDAARGFAERMLREGGTSDRGRLTRGFLLALSREPRPAELSVLEQLLTQLRAQYEEDRPAAEAFLKVGDRPVPSELDAAELAAWTNVARTILNLHGTITRN
jgi:hypothetical protein